MNNRYFMHLSSQCIFQFVIQRIKQPKKKIDVIIILRYTQCAHILDMRIMKQIQDN